MRSSLPFYPGREELACRVGMMLFRLRQYKVAPGKTGVFNDFFLERLLPVQKRYGARLVGRWQNEDGRVAALWVYDDAEQYKAIQAKVRGDPDSVSAQEFRRTELEPLFTETEEAFIEK